MTRMRHSRGWGLIAAIAILLLLALTLVPHGHASDSSGLLAILPLFFAGIISPLILLPRLAYCYAGRVPDAPALPARFQRPPPFALA